MNLCILRRELRLQYLVGVSLTACSFALASAIAESRSSFLAQRKRFPSQIRLKSRQSSLYKYVFLENSKCSMALGEIEVTTLILEDLARDRNFLAHHGSNLASAVGGRFDGVHLVPA